MRNFKVIMAYNGANYHGFQRQNNALAIQQVVEAALEKLIGEKITINGCSRTDAGVHARDYCFNFSTNNNITCNGLVLGMNNILPDDIAILHCEEVDATFHARFCCTGKEYEYIIHNSRIKNPFYNNTAYRYWYPIDEKKLEKAAQDYVGKHDFKAFCSSDCDKDNTIRTMYYFHVKRKNDMVHFNVFGDGFLYNMVRIMVGTLLYINEGKICENEIPQLIANKDRTKAGITVPPQGLYLNKVCYSNFDDEKD